MSSWLIDNSHSTAEFSIRHLMVSNVKGRFQKVEGTINFDETNPEKSSVAATIEVASLTTHDEKRDGHLLSADFFDAATYPSITFKSTKVAKDGDNEFKVTGDLTIHGVTKSVVLDVEYSGSVKSPFGHTASGFTAKTSINRKDFDLGWNVALETGGVLVGEKVNITLEIEAIAQVAATA